tara:strand:+ start:3744 stop:4172 length:429 start_codon:yes stop_codon:yes gene_type:complete
LTKATDQQRIEHVTKIFDLWSSKRIYDARELIHNEISCSRKLDEKDILLDEKDILKVHNWLDFLRESKKESDTKKYFLIVHMIDIMDYAAYITTKNKFSGSKEIYNFFDSHKYYYKILRFYIERRKNKWKSLVEQFKKDDKS